MEFAQSLTEEIPVAGLTTGCSTPGSQRGRSVFSWNVKQGGGFSYPYINAATFRESDKAYLARPNIWNSSFAFQYGAIAPNIRGDLGAAALLAGGTIGYPKFAVSLDDDFNPPPRPRGRFRRSLPVLTGD